MEARDREALQEIFSSGHGEPEPGEPLGGVGLLVPVALIMLLAALVCILMIPWRI